MIKQLITIAFAAAFGIAHAADHKPASAEVKPAAAVTAPAKGEVPLAAEAGKAPAPEVKAAVGSPEAKPVKKVKPEAKKEQMAKKPASGEAAAMPKAEPAKAVEAAGK